MSYQFDDDGGGNHPDAAEPTQAEIDSPAVDHFTELMEEGTDAAVEEAAAEMDAQDAAVRAMMQPRSDVVQKLSRVVAQAMNDGVKSIDTRVLVVEAQLALGQILVNLAENALMTCDFDEFLAVQRQSLNVVSTMGDYIASRVPSVAQLQEADSVTEGPQ